MKKLLRWFGYVPVARLIVMEDKHNDEMLRLRSEHAVKLQMLEREIDEQRRRLGLGLQRARRDLRAAESENAEHVRVIGVLLEELMVSK